jgi:hypothetical protein
VRTQCSPCPCRHLPRRRPPRRLCPLHGGSIASSALRKHTQKGNILDAKSWGKPDLYYMSENTIHGSSSLKTSHFVRPDGNHEASPVRKRVCPPYLMYIYYKLLNTTKEKRETIETQMTTAAHGDFRRSTSEAYPHSMCRALLRRSTDAT